MKNAVVFILMAILFTSPILAGEEKGQEENRFPEEWLWWGGAVIFLSAGIWTLSTTLTLGNPPDSLGKELQILGWLLTAECLAASGLYAWMGYKASER